MQENRWIYGNAFAGDVTPLSRITAESGTVIVEGKVFGIDHMELKKQKAWIIRFDITDGTSSIRVCSYLSGWKALPILDGVKKGMRLQIRGKVYDSKYEGQRVLHPFSICAIQASPRMDTAPEKRVELRLHTRMSAMDGLTDVSKAMERAAKWGHTALGITDHCVAHAFPEAMRAAEKTGVKVLYGCEMNAFKNEGGQAYPITVLARNAAGLKLLYRLISDSHIRYFEEIPRIPRSACIGHRNELLLGSGGTGSELLRAVAEHRTWEDLMHIACLFDFLEIEPAGNYRALIRQGLAADEEELREFNRTIVALGEVLDIPVAATGNVHFLDPEDGAYRRVLLAARGRQDADLDLPLCYRTTDEMLEDLAYLGQEKCYEVVVTNTNLVADRCEVITPLSGGLSLPTIEGSAGELEDLVKGKLYTLYGAHPPKIVTDRLDRETSIIRAQHTGVVFTAAQRLARASWEQGYPVGSRGLIGCSLTAFLAGITEINPLPAHYRCPECGHTDFDIQSSCLCGADLPGAVCPVCGTDYEKDGHSIPLEPLFGIYGEKPADIDLNFSRDYQASAVAHCKAIFGEDHVFPAGTIGTVSGRTGYGYAEKYLRERDPDAPKAELRRLAEGCTGVKRTTGQHPGGLVIVPKDKDILDFCPIQHPGNDPASEAVVTHFEYSDLARNLLKLDLLGHDDPTMLKMMHEMTGIAPKSIPLDDPEILRIFTSTEPLHLPDDDPVIGKTGSLGVPEFGTDYVRNMLLETHPNDFDDLIRISGLSHGVDTWLHNAQDVLRSGEATLKEVISTRDDILEYLTRRDMEPQTAFEIMEAVRKGRAARYGLRAEWEERMTELGVPPWYVDSMKKIGYLFPRAHAATYVMSACRIAWYKVHRPLAFYCAYFELRDRKGSFDPEMMCRGLDTVTASLDKLNEAPGNWENYDLLSTLRVCYEYYMRGFGFSSAGGGTSRGGFRIVNGGACGRIARHLLPSTAPG